MLKNNNILTGAIIGLFLPLVVFGIIFLIISVSGIDNAEDAEGFGSYFKMSNIMLLSIAVNLLPFRYFMVNLKYDKTGRSILLVTMAYVVVFFFFFL